MTQSTGVDRMESNEESARHSSFVSDIPDLNEEPPQSFYINPLMNEIPVIFHPYISRIQNVMGDGNCGFQAIAVCLGYGEDQWLYMRQQLLDELYINYDAYGRVFGDRVNDLRTSLSFFQMYAPTKHWMIMPLTGFLIANKFGVIVTFLTKRGSLIIFPLWKDPEEFQCHQMIAVSLVYGDYYVMVQLEGDFPMPIISHYWIQHRAPCAAGWETEYTSRLELYRQLRPRTPAGRVITIDDY